MSKKAGTALSVMAMVFMGALASPLTVLAADAEETYQPALYATFWSLLPPLVAIVLALITKEVYSSLFVGIVVGALIYSGFKFEGTVTHIFEGGIIKVLSDSYNVGILIFLVILGSVVCMMNRAGGSAAFGRWAGKHIHTRVGAELAAIILGILIFIDDYFNCLTVGSVMRPVTDRHQCIKSETCISDRCYSRSGMYHRTDLFLGCCSQRVRRGKMDLRFLYVPSHIILRDPYDCNDGWHGTDENRVWCHGNS